MTDQHNRELTPALDNDLGEPLQRDERLQMQIVGVVDEQGDRFLGAPEQLLKVAAAHEFAVYVSSNASSLINYGERYRAGERISSCLAESTVNAVISKRFAKRQQMQWTKRGAHLLLQIRTRALDGTLRPLFERWYPGLANDNTAVTVQAAAA
jgi:hypothetical protein